MSYQDPPTPGAVVRGILGVAASVAAASLAIAFVTTGRVLWQLVALSLALWGAWSFFGQLLDTLIAPLGRFLGSALTGGSMPPGTRISIEQETAMLERLLASDLAPRRAVRIGMRLAEIYRTHQKDTAKADALIARLASRYPDVPELKYVRGG